MKAAVLHEINQPLVIEDLQVDNPGPKEVLVRTTAAGICHSDYHFMNGSYACDLPAVMGHESAGVVEKVGRDVTYLKPGDHVISCMSMFCGSCSYCLTGKSFGCDNLDQMARNDRLRLDQQSIYQGYNLGSYAEQMLLHEHALVKIRPDMPLDKAALIGCAVTTGVGAVIHTAQVKPGSTVVVIGCGGVGLSAVNGSALAGAARIIAIDVHDSKLELAKQFGATDGVNASQVDPVEAIIEMTSGGTDYAFEALGKKKTCEQAFDMLRPGGTACIIGMVPEDQKIEINAANLIYDRKLIGSNMGSNAFRVDMPRFVEFYM
ncbi:MAG: Zn-dependent alcohol dehydrogenase, partial [Chloroflexota bacterium]